MGKKRTMDEGLKFINRLGFNKYNSIFALNDALVSKFKNEEIEEWIRAFNKLLQSDTGDRNTGFSRYELKNDNIERSIFYTGGYDSDIIRQCINWIANNKQYFGKTILDVGCDIGIVSCYLAITFPDSHIVSIDQGTNWLPVAQYLSDKLGIDNLEFKKAGLKDFGDERFDTVFTMRTVQENRDRKYWKGVDYLSSYAEIHKNMTKDYADLLVSHIRTGGALVSMEKFDVCPLLLGWMNAVNSDGFVPQLDTYKSIKCIELGQECYIQALAFKDGNPCTSKELYDFYCSQFWFGERQDSFNGYAAEVYLDRYHGEVKKSYNVFNPKTDENVGLFEICKHAEQNGKYLFYFNTGGNSPTALFIIRENELPQAYVQMDEILRMNEQKGLKFRSRV